MLRLTILAFALVLTACASTPQTSQAGPAQTCSTAADGTVTCVPASDAPVTYPKRESRYSK